MSNYDDYQLSEMENAAVEKSKNLKRGLAVGGAVLAAGGTAAFGAKKIYDGHHQEDNEEVTLTSDDLLAGANAGADDTPQPETQAEVHEVHHVHHVVEEVPVREEPVVTHEPDIEVTETSIIYDENGDVVTVYDQGTIDGVKWVAMDRDNDGDADYLGIDENRNGIIEENEIYELKDNSYIMGQGQRWAGYTKDENGEYVKEFDIENPGKSFMAENNQHDEWESIHNDYEDERTGEQYRGDYAENNDDYNNRGGEQYRASMSVEQAMEDRQADDFSGYTAETYNDDATDTSYNDQLYAEAGETYDDDSSDYMASYDEPADDDTSDYMASYDEPADDSTDDIVSDYGTDVFDA